MLQQDQPSFYPANLPIAEEGMDDSRSIQGNLQQCLGPLHRKGATETTLANCWKKILKSQHKESTVSSSGSTDPDVAEITPDPDIPLGSEMEEWANEEVPVCEELTSDAIVETLLNPVPVADDDSDDDEIEVNFQPRVPINEKIKAAEELMGQMMQDSYFTASDTLYMTSLIDRMRKYKISSARQSNMDSYFSRSTG